MLEVVLQLVDKCIPPIYEWVFFVFSQFNGSFTQKFNYIFYRPCLFILLFFKK
jgi:hypothetical protein